MGQGLFRAGLRATAVALVGATALLTSVQSSSANCYRLLKPNGWQYETVCSNSGGGGGGSGGGGNAAGIAAGLGAGAAILGMLGEMAHQQEMESQAATNAEAARAAAARAALCRGNWQQASTHIRSGNGLVDRLRAGEAIPHYRSAISLLSRCGDARNVAVARQNLAEAERQYAAVKPDNRVNDATALYGANNPYGASKNPFESKNAAPATAAGPRVKFTDVVEQARQKCSGSEKDKARWTTCMLVQEARAIMEADPDIKAICSLETSASARDQCALKAYAAQVGAQHAGLSDNQNCYFDRRGRQCIAGGGAKPAAGQPKVSLRDQLKKKLADAKKLKGDTTPVTEAEIDKAVAEQAVPTTAELAMTTQPPHSPQADRDDPLLNYLNTTSGSSAAQTGIVGKSDGDLGQSASTADQSGSYKDRFGIDLNSSQTNDQTIFDQVRGQYRNQQLRGKVGR